VNVCETGALTKITIPGKSVVCTLVPLVLVARNVIADDVSVATALNGPIAPVLAFNDAPAGNDPVTKL
jgi:hypothetical protein